ncbi:MAG: hypothetical protein A2542_01895 [Parcubacteria group bacterium RIFOXYD2_FULL_52_8]|nr:MAG: hypothetical protein A2542_01895 [Parcubacteria group bacterium RIFOXYD2_FULL_52_8]
MPEEGFAVRVGEFQGPLEVVLRLVEERKMLVNDISLAEVADAFLAHLQSLEQLPLDEIAQFLVVATTLLLIKSRSLLPQLTISKEEESSIEELESRLRLYQQVKSACDRLRVQSRKRRMFLGSPRPRAIAFRLPAPHRDGSSEVSLGGLHQALLRMVSDLPRLAKIPEATIQKVMSVEAMMTSMLTRLQTALSFKLSGANRHRLDPATKHERLHIIVSFLAILELAKRGTVALTQADHFHDIEVETQQFGTPQYF